MAAWPTRFRETGARVLRALVELILMPDDLFDEPPKPGVIRIVDDFKKWLLKDEEDPDGEEHDMAPNEALWRAVEDGNAQAVKQFLDGGADPNGQDNDGWTPLFWAALKGRVNTALILLYHGAEAKVAANDGTTPLHVAAGFDHTSLAVLLLSRGANVDAQTVAGLTPLHVAVGAGHCGLARVLLEHGANVSLVTREGRTPQDIALQGEKGELVELLRSHESSKASGGKKPVHPVA